MIKKINFTNRFDYLFILFFSFLINFYYSSIGVLPQDTFAYYDTGYRVLNGAVPFKDYWTVSGPFIDYAQALLFYLFNVSWKTYILNGSILNSIITTIFFYTLKNFGQKRFFNLFYSICFSILANPSMGVPFPDHYSAFLSLLGIFFFLLAIKKDEKLFWYLVPFFYFLAFFSKQSPAAYLLIPIIISSIIYIIYYKRFEFIKYFFISSLCCVIFLISIIYLNNIDINQFLNQYILFPQTIAEDRIKNYQFNMNNLFFQFKFIHLFLIILISITFTKIIKNRIFEERKIFLINITIILASIALMFHQLITKNFIFIFFLIPMISSFIQLNFFKIKKYHLIVSLFLISMTLFSTIKYHLRFNEHRKMLNLEKINLNPSLNANLIHSSLSGLEWLTREYPNKPLNEINQLKASMLIIKEDKTNKMFLSGYLFFSAILNEDLNNPSRWPSLGDASNPDVNNKYHENYKQFVRNLVKIKQIETVYSTKDNDDDIFINIFDESCRKTKVINDFLTRHDIRGCKK